MAGNQFNHMCPKTPKQHFIIVKTKSSGCFISDNLENYAYHQGSINRFLFDGEVPQKTPLKDWFKINDVPVKVELVRGPTARVLGYKLKLGYTPSERLPANVDRIFIDKNEEFEIFYEQIAEQIPQENEVIDFYLHVIAEKDKWEPVKIDFELKYGLIDRLTLNPVLLPERPCKLSSKDSYKLIREYIKRNIGLTVAQITSDYDFCLTVTKVIPLAEKVAYQKNIARYGAKRPKYITDYRTTRSVEVFKCGPKDQYGKVHQGYEACVEFQGENYEDLQKNIDEYLKELITKINEPVCDCPTCKGLGVIIK